jgi:ATP-binding cassette subfamily B protein/subfamily B ATP-binding cassette protein MsbA
MLRKLWRFAPYIARQWLILSAVLLLSCATAAVTALEPWPLKILVDAALESGQPPATLARLAEGIGPQGLILAAGLASLLLFATSSALNVGLSWGWMAAGQGMVYRLSEDLFARLQRLSLLLHRRRSVGDSLDRLSTDTWCIYTVCDILLVGPTVQVLTTVGIVLAAWNLDPGLTLLTVTVAPAMILVTRLFAPGLTRRTWQARSAQAGLGSFVHQTLTAIPLVQAFCAEERNCQTFRELADYATNLSQRGVLMDKLCGLAGGATRTLGAALVLYSGAVQVLAGKLTVGGLLVFLAYLKSLHATLDRLFQNYAKLAIAQANIDRLLEVLDLDDPVRDRPHAVSLAARVSRPHGSIKFENVTFGYEPGRPVLEHIGLELRPGETVALAGHTGAGKSTLASLIPRFFDPWEGQVRLDGIDVRELQLADLRRHVALVLQDCFLLPMSVAENIAYGRPQADREEIIRAARQANADEFICQLPSGYDTIVGQRGATLSGGEKQRLAIARAILKDAPVVILDEPTAALDSQSEAAVLEALQHLREGRTTLIIAHRLSTIRHADRIVILEHGRIAQVGKHEELLHSGGLYQRFHNLQFVPYPEVVG